MLSLYLAPALQRRTAGRGGGVRLIAPVLKTGRPQGLMGSNPIPSALDTSPASRRMFPTADGTDLRTSAQTPPRGVGPGAGVFRPTSLFACEGLELLPACIGLVKLPLQFLKADLGLRDAGGIATGVELGGAEVRDESGLLLLERLDACR